MMATGFERDIRGCPARSVPGLSKCDHFGVPHRCAVRGAASNDMSAPHNDAANGWPWGHPPKPACAKAQGMGHMPFVLFGVAHSSWSAGRSSLTNLSKSSAAWKFLYTLAKRT